MSFYMPNANAGLFIGDRRRLKQLEEASHTLIVIQPDAMRDGKQIACLVNRPSYYVYNKVTVRQNGFFRSSSFAWSKVRSRTDSPVQQIVGTGPDVGRAKLFIEAEAKAARKSFPDLVACEDNIDTL